MPKKANSTKFAKGNEFAWKPGQSGNPNGRPKARTISEALREQLPVDTGSGLSHAEAIAHCLIQLAMGTTKTAVVAAKEIADRTEGKVLPVSAVDHQIDNDLLSAAKRIMSARSLAGCLRVAKEQLTRYPEWTPLDDQLEQEALTGEFSVAEKEKFIGELERLVEICRADMRVQSRGLATS